MSRFEKGQPGGPGRPKGSKNKLSEDFVCTLADDFEEHGAEAIVQCREDSAAKYLDIITKVLPKDYNVKVDRLDELSIEELEERARELGDTLGIYASSGKAKAKEKPKHIN